MKIRVLLRVACICSAATVLSAQSTWLGTSNGTFTNSANWNSSTFPSSGADLTFGTTTNFNINIGSNYTANSLTFSGAYPHYSFSGSGGPTLTIGAGGISVADTSGGGAGIVDFSNNLNLAVSSNQTWVINGNATVSGTLSGAGTITKTGSGYLGLSGSNTFSGITVSSGALYVGQNTAAGTGPLTLGASATLATQFGDVTLANAISVASGATLGATGNSSALTLGGTVTLGSATSTVNLGSGDVKFTGALTGPASTALTFQGNAAGIAILSGTVTNVSSINANNTAVAFGAVADLPATSIQASGGGYVSVADTTSSTVTAFLGKITDKANFNGTLGFDSGDNSTPKTFTNAIDLTGYTAGQVRIGTLSSAVLTGTITPVAQSYDFGGYGTSGGLLVVKSNLADHGGATGVSVVSPTGSSQHGLVLVLQGSNSFTGNLSASYSSVILDSATAVPSGSFNLGTNAYLGYTEAATGYTSFADFASHLGSYTATSILGFDSHSLLDGFLTGAGGGTARTVNDSTLDLSGLNPIFLGTGLGATINSTRIIAPSSDHTLRLVNLQTLGALTINTTLVDADVHALVAGQTGTQGSIVLNGTNTYAGGTTLQGGSLIVANGSGLGTGPVTVLSTPSGSSNNMAIAAASGSVTLTNSIAVTDYLNIGSGTTDDSGNFNPGTSALTLSGLISDVDGTHHGRLYLTAPTTLAGANTYSGGTYVEANTTVSSNTGLGTGFVDLGYNATLTFTAAHPSIGGPANAGNFINNAGTGTIKLDPAVVDLTINQSSSAPFSGQITGTAGPSAAALIKNGAGLLSLLGNNAGQFTGGTTINTGNIAIGDGNVTTATFGGNVATATGTALVFRPGGSQDMSYNGSITGAGGVNINGSGVATTSVTGGSSNFTGNTAVNTGTFHLAADNVWSNASAVSLNGGTTLRVDGDQTFKSLTGNGSITLSTTGKTLTLAGSGTLGGVISGNGSLTKSTASTTLSLIAANTYAGGTFITGGILQLGTGGGAGSVTGPIDISSGASLALNRSGITTVSNAISGAGSVVISTGTVTLNGANTYTGGTVLNGSTIAVGANSNLGTSGGITFNSGSGTPTVQTTAALGTVNRNLTFTSAGTFNTNGFDTTLSGTLNGSGAFTKSGVGKLTLSGNSASSFTGTTSVNGGILAVSGSLAGSSLTSVGGVGARLFGSGAIGPVAVTGGGVLGAATPAGAPAAFSATSYSLTSGATLDVFLSDATSGAQGTGWSLLSSPGALNLNNSTLTIALLTVNNAGTAAAATNFNPLVPAQFLLATAAGGITNFTGASINTTGFLNSLNGSFAASVSGNNLILSYTPNAAPVPEPASTGALAGAAILAAALWRRRRKG